MKRHGIQLMPAAEADLDAIFAFIWEQSGSRVSAENYLRRLERFLADLDLFPARGTIRSDLREGLRVIGFERSVSVAFKVEGETVVVFRILAGGRSLK